jgi:hypothetical protein
MIFFGAFFFTLGLLTLAHAERADWFDKETGGTAFICDTLIALGLVERAK